MWQNPQETKKYLMENFIFCAASSDEYWSRHLEWSNGIQAI